LLQSETYATKVVHTSLPWLPSETVERQVGARMERAKLWESEERPAFWAVLHESLIRNPLLEPEEMATQLTHIAHVIRSTQSVLQILPETAVTHPFMMGMAKVMTFPDAPPVVYTEGLHSGQLIDFPTLVKNYRRSYDLLRAAALPPDESLTLIERAAEDYRNGQHRT
jgi:hypothetical protein